MFIIAALGIVVLIGKLVGIWWAVGTVVAGLIIADFT